MARRDVRRHRGRTAVASLMIGVPIALLCFAVTLGRTSDVGLEEIAAVSLGSAQASLNPVTAGDVEGPGAGPGAGPGLLSVEQHPNGHQTTSGDVTPFLPGYDAAGEVWDNAEALQRLTGGTVTPWSTGDVRVRSGDRTSTLTGLAAQDPPPGRVVVQEGRAPAGPHEVLLSPRAVRDGLPASGQIIVEAPDGERPVTVVGIGRAQDAYGGFFDVISTEPLGHQGESGWLLQRDQPVPWSEVRELNAHGFVVVSAEVLSDPPEPAELPDGMSYEDDSEGLYAMGGALLLISIVLLVAPAFAVGALRQRHVLALAAMNGATTNQLRRAPLATGVVIGALSSLIAAAVGVAAAAAVGVLAARQQWMPTGPVDIPWGAVAALAGLGLLSALVAALLPATRLARLDVIRAVRGQVVSGPPSRVLPVAGLIAIVLSAGYLLLTGGATGFFGQALAVITLVLGGVLLVPTLLHLSARLSRRLPLSARMAGRDLGRHRARSAPTVGAVLAGTAALTVALIGGSSDDEQGRLSHQPLTLDGEAIVYVPEGGAGSSAAADRAEATRLSARITTVDPSVKAVPAQHFHVPVGSDLPENGPVTPFVAVLAPGCDLARALYDPAVATRAHEEMEVAQEALPPCEVSGGTLGIRQLVVLPPTEIIRRFDLTGADATAITKGAVVHLQAPGEAVAAHDDTLTIATARAKLSVEGPPTVVPGSATQREVSVVTRDLDPSTDAAALGGGLVVPSGVATSWGWDLRTDRLALHTEDGPLSAETVQRLATTLGGDDGAQVQQELGYASVQGVVVLVLLGVFTLLLLVVTLTSTALGLAEQEQDQSTLAAVGASRSTRRRMAACGALATALVGAVLGIGIGLIPGWAIATELTSYSTSPYDPDGGPIVVIPWLPLLAAAVGVPLVAAALAGLSIRRDPAITRRRT